MRITHKDLNSLKYPLFRLPNHNITIKDGIVRLDGQIIDDRNMPGETLGKRRLQTPFKNLGELKAAVDGPAGVIKSPSGTMFLDSLGEVLYYEKTIWARLNYRKITKVKKLTTHSLLFFHGVSKPFTYIIHRGCYTAILKYPPETHDEKYEKSRS